MGDNFARVETACGKLKTTAVAGLWLDFWGQLHMILCIFTTIRHSTMPVRPRAGPRPRSPAGLSAVCVGAGRGAFFVFLILLPCRAFFIGGSPTY